MEETDAPTRNPSTESLRSNIDLNADRDPDPSDSACRDGESNSTNTLADNVSTWRFTITGLALSLGVIPFAELAAVFDLRCNNDVGDSIEQKFTLDMTFGSFTFSQAKTIDIAWDTVIGQGGRFLHGWIVYRFVLHPFLVILMERFSVTTDFYLAMSFSRSSFGTLWILVTSLRRRESATVFLGTLMVVYTLGYTLLFSVIWGAATGYVSLSQNFYPMPNGDVVPLNSPDLSLCWVLEDTRLGVSQPLVELGPNFADVGGSTKELTLDGVKYPSAGLCLQETADVNQTLHYSTGGWRRSNATTIWDYVAITGDANSSRNSSLNIKSIRDYALTAQTLRMAVHGQYWKQEAKPKVTTPETSEIVSYTPEGLPATWWTVLFGRCMGASKTFTGLGLASSIDSPHYDSNENVTVGVQVQFPPHGKTGNESVIDIAFWSRFVRNTSMAVGQNTTNDLPYNSTIWLNGASIQLAAPFLDFGHGCYSPSIFTSLGNCVCYKGEPIPVHYIAKERAVCRTVPGVVWGFSSFLTRLGLGLECAWLACCAICYGLMSASSGILRKKLIWTTSTRRAALVFSRAVSDIKGEEMDQLSEDLLASKLKGILLGYPRHNHLRQEEQDVDTPSGIRLVANPPHREHELTDLTNASLERAKQKLKSSAKDTFRKRKLSTTEVYEDLNWRVYDRV
ncbi:hypothetical protein PG997_015091 [Apiospora hydei]|uniref:Uncharacterized protein n=1 Tax=Apiospora hydei TaxID=1337664 RepID=A0ABR1UVM9_9PEZI